ncbi:hypothetical protein GCM10027288_31210 [Bordetella tumbae]
MKIPPFAQPKSPENGTVPFKGGGLWITQTIRMTATQEFRVDDLTKREVIGINTVSVHLNDDVVFRNRTRTKTARSNHSDGVRK